MNITEILSWNEKKARKYMEKLRWSKGAVCPHCRSKKVIKLKGSATRDGVYKCKNSPCRKQFTVTVGTIFHGSRIPLRKWICAFWLMCSAKKGYSANQLSRDISVTYKTAWFMAHRIRHAMKYKKFDKLNGVVEVDETYVGGKEKNKPQSYKSRKAREKKTTEAQKISGRKDGKLPVVALVERDGRVKSQVLYNITGKKLRYAVGLYINEKATVMTDESKMYSGIGYLFDGGHETVNHSIAEYARGNVSTNTVESYFALFKRGVTGIYHQISPRHLQRYCDEFSFRWNFRKLPVQDALNEAIKMGDGKRLRYRNRIKKYSDHSGWRSK